MPISCECPECGKKLKAADSAAGKKAKCPDCGAAVPIPAKKKPKPKAADESEFDLQNLDIDAGMAGPVEEEQIACPACSEMINASAGKCRYCGEILGAPRKKKKAKRVSSGPGMPVSIIVAIVVECIFVGVNVFNIIGGLTLPKPAVPANVAPGQQNAYAAGVMLGLLVVPIIRLLLEVSIALGLWLKKSAVRVLALVLDGIGAVFVVGCGAVGLIGIAGMQAQGMGQLPQGGAGLAGAIAMVVLQGALYITQFATLQSASAQEYLDQ